MSSRYSGHTTRLSGDSADDSDVIDSPRPIQIVIAKGDHSFELDIEALEAILLNNNVKNKKVVVLSVAGAFRKGKSFLLDFLIRYLEALEADADVEEWLGSESEPLGGFSWRGGAERETNGILMWNRAFIITKPSTGEEVAVLLLDTQGAFDNQSTVRDCATIFALSTMITSVQVYNLSQMIQENDLQHLQLFTEYGRLAMQESEYKPFQSLLFLVRDWSYPYEHSYGHDGGQEYLDKILKLTDSQHEQLQLVRRHIHSCFDKVACFLMPHPGLKVATDKCFDGRLADIDGDFKMQLSDLAPLLLHPTRLVVKTINGNSVTGKDLLEYFKVYMKIYQGEDLPEPKSMLEATAEGNNLTALAAAKEYYKREMNELCGGNTPYMAESELERQHLENKENAIDKFRATKKMGGQTFSQKYEEQLSKEIETEYEEFVSMNNSKNIFHAARTPAVLFALMVVFYLISYLVGFIGIQVISSLANYCLGISILLLLAWSYIRYSGEYREMGSRIDSITELIWDKVLSPVSGQLMNKGIQHAAKLALKKSQ
ncbi:atlastin-2-like [Dysidea avara]|uniref:atlastin-2-like n=1 Tax=Dysidea avara TaxID=196820 RepID=UPI00332148C2